MKSIRPQKGRMSLNHTEITILNRVAKENSTDQSLAGHKHKHCLQVNKDHSKYWFTNPEATKFQESPDL